MSKPVQELLIRHCCSEIHNGPSVLAAVDQLRPFCFWQAQTAMQNGAKVVLWVAFMVLLPMVEAIANLGASMAVALDRAAHRQAVRTDLPTIVRYLQDVLEQRLIAVIAGVSDAKAVGRWARGTQTPHPDTEKRLRLAFQITQMLMTAESSDTVRAWFIGMNPELDDEAPALMLGKEPLRVLQAARFFLANG